MNGLYAGSFYPFTYGHDSVVRAAYPLFKNPGDILYIVPSLNEKKGLTKSLSMDISVAIEKYYARIGLKNIVVHRNWEDFLTADLCERLKVDYLIRGVRNTTDFLYEEQLASANALINPNLETIYVRGKNDISGSLVRELLKYKKDIREFVPLEIYTVMMKYRED